MGYVARIKAIKRLGLYNISVGKEEITNLFLKRARK
jgi:hypothetical protein